MEFQYIKSKNNELLKQIRKLKDKKYRDDTNLFLVEGTRFIEEAIDTDFKIKNIFITEESLSNTRINNIVAKQKSNVKISILTMDLFKSICSTENPQGILAVVKYKESSFNDITENNNFYVFVDKVQDPGNLGTIIRAAHASGASAVILRRGTVDLYNEKTLRGTMGSIFHIPIIYYVDTDYLNELINRGYTIISSSLNTDVNFYSCNLTKKVVIVVGNEGNGISDEIIKLSNILVKLPMPGGAESLNVGVATGIMLYEIVRQRQLVK